MPSDYHFHPGAQFIAAGPDNRPEPITVTLNTIHVTATRTETIVKFHFTNDCHDHKWTLTPHQALAQMEMANAVQIK